MLFRSKFSRISRVSSSLMASKDKDVYDIRKFDGTNFALWKEQMQDVLVQKKQRLPILYPERTEEMDMTQLEWEELDALSRSTIRLHLVESVYFSVLECPTTFATWRKLCNSYEKESATNKVFLFRKLYGLRKKESQSVAAHLNEFDSLFAQIRAQ